MKAFPCLKGNPINSQDSPWNANWVELATSEFSLVFVVAVVGFIAKIHIQNVPGALLHTEWLSHVTQMNSKLKACLFWHAKVDMFNILDPQNCIYLKLSFNSPLLLPLHCHCVCMYANDMYLHFCKYLFF